ncbi:MAG: PIG-L deacetylase family protein [Candidatus Aenigmatarchaeota archaeon]
MKNIVVFAPHPDDEVLGCGGTIAKKIKHGDNVFVVFLTDGRYALKNIGVDNNPSPTEMKVIRREEAIKAAKVLGLQEKNIFFLDIEDKSLNRYKNYALRIIVRIIKEIYPTEIFYPQELEYNVDHRTTNMIVKEALKKLHFQTTEYRYAVAWKFPFYLLLHVLNEHIFYNLMSFFLKSSLYYIDISEYLAIKKKAIEQYKSQLIIHSSNQKRPAIRQSILRISLKKKEIFFI